MTTTNGDDERIRQKEKKKEEELKNQKQTNLRYQAVLEGINNYIERLDLILDPPTRSLLFLNTMLLITDNITAWLEIGLTNGDVTLLTETSKEKGKVVIGKLKKEFSNLMNVAQYAMYSPDHPVGKKILGQLQNKYTSPNSTKKQPDKE